MHSLCPLKLHDCAVHVLHIIIIRHGYYHIAICSSLPEALFLKPRAESMRAKSCDWISDSPVFYRSNVTITTKVSIIDTTVVSLANIHAFMCFNIPHNFGCIHGHVIIIINFGQDNHYEAATH